MFVYVKKKTTQGISLQIIGERVNRSNKMSGFQYDTLTKATLSQYKLYT